MAIAFASLRSLRQGARTHLCRAAGLLFAAALLSACQTDGSANGGSATADADKVRGSLIVTDQTLGLTDEDRRVALSAEFRALERTPAGAAISWSNPQTEHSGEVLPGPAYQVNAQRCRDYTHTVTAGGEPMRFQATACRAPEGDWLIVT
ncbi:RT0821/Lpp0805 family surface protein [Amorphus orientalis]|uniref:Surface antigen n=1 Tax=Amorphus orientalis TaxID=649198 RepID=A0AAE3VNY6_9HYPH|nr:RT0821/Lpp0805 family surface protein [Amorphus orientalis]MDQ0315130.1 surface antigen [Amorphus orientalis]